MQYFQSSVLGPGEGVLHVGHVPHAGHGLVLPVYLFIFLNTPLAVITVLSSIKPITAPALHDSHEKERQIFDPAVLAQHHLSEGQ